MRDYVKTISNIIGIIAFSLILIVILLGQTFVVSGESMEPTLSNHENVFADKLSLNMFPLKHNDIVVFKLTNAADDILIKRIVGLPNETINIDEKTVKVPANSYFVVGDNTAHSTDSRAFGAINKENILGRVILVYQPISNLRVIR